MTPDLYTAGGELLPERRHKGRRDDDPDRETVKGAIYWAHLLILNKGKAVAFCTAIGIIGGYMAGCGARVHEFDAVKQDVTTLKTGLVEVKGEIVQIQSGQRLSRYIMCVSVPANAPPEAHHICEEIVKEGPP